MKKYKNEVIIGYNNKPIKLPGEKGEVELRLEHAFNFILQRIQPTNSDERNIGIHFALSLDKCRGAEFIEIEDSAYDWILPKAERIILELPFPVWLSGKIIYDMIATGYIEEDEKKK